MSFLQRETYIFLYQSKYRRNLPFLYFFIVTHYKYSVCTWMNLTFTSQCNHYPPTCSLSPLAMETVRLNILFSCCGLSRLPRPLFTHLKHCQQLLAHVRLCTNNFTLCYPLLNSWNLSALLFTGLLTLQRRRGK